MNRYIILMCAAGAVLPAAAESAVSVYGTEAITVTPDAKTGLSEVIVARDTDGALIRFRPQSPSANITWERYSSLGGGYAEAVSPEFVTDANVWQIKASADDMGYIITEGGTRHCFWVVNYANHTWDVADFDIAASDCDRVSFTVGQPAGAIAYYDINGRRVELDRGIRLDYSTMEYSDFDKAYAPVQTSTTFSSLSSTVSARAPLCDTPFILYPDRFATAWGIGTPLTTPNFTATAVEARTAAEQQHREAGNEQGSGSDTDALGGSAPCDITFAAAVTDAAIYRRWEISTTPDFADVLYAYDSLDFTYSFSEAGNFYVRFTADNAAGSCEYLSDVYTVTVGESRLDCPNAFSPGASEGVNDEWKVSYRSIVEFECSIFNSWGQPIISFTDPSQGWDGRYHGKLVGSGVYYYVIKARGADGKVYNLSGDINIIDSRRSIPVTQQ